MVRRARKEAARRKKGVWLNFTVRFLVFGRERGRIIRMSCFGVGGNRQKRIERKFSGKLELFLGN